MSCFQRSHTAPAHVSFLAGPHRSRACFVFSGPSPLTIEIACLFNMFLAVPITAYSRFSGPLTAHRSSSGALTAHHLCHSSLADQQLLLSLFCSAVLATAHAVPTRLTLFPIALKLFKHKLQRKKDTAEAQERKRRRQASHERILHFVGMHGVPDASIVNIIDALRGEPELFYDIKSQGSVSRHIHEFLDTVAETTTLRLRDDEGHEEDCMWTYASTRKLLQHFVRECPSFAEMFFEALRASPNGPLSPWHLIFYVDEIVIGAQLKKKRPTSARYMHSMPLFASLDHRFSVARTRGCHLVS